MLTFHYEKIEEALAREIQKILGSHREDFTEDTIVGSDINQIRHIFYYLMASGTPVTVSYLTEVYRGKISEVFNTSFILTVDNFEETAFRRCRLKFEAFSVLYQFEVLILDLDRTHLTIKMPYFIQSAQHRKHKRVPTADLFIRMITTYQPIFESGADNQIVEHRFRDIVDELKKDRPELKIIYRILLEEINRISPDNEIVIGEKPGHENLLISTIYTEKKTVFIDDTNVLESYFDPIRSFGLINFQKKYSEIKKYHAEEDAIHYFEELRKQYRSKFYHKIITAPLQIFDKVVGYIFVYSSLLDTRHLSVEQAHIIDLLSRLFSYAMSKTVISRSYYDHALLPVVNVSMSGLLFQLNNVNLFDYLISNDMVKLEMDVKQYTLSIRGELTRYFPYQKGFNLGVNFLEAEPDDYRHLEQYIFEISRKKHNVA